VERALCAATVQQPRRTTTNTYNNGQQPGDYISGNGSSGNGSNTSNGNNSQTSQDNGNQTDDGNNSNTDSGQDNGSQANSDNGDGGGQTSTCGVGWHKPWYNPWGDCVLDKVDTITVKGSATCGATSIDHFGKCDHAELQPGGIRCNFTSDTDFECPNVPRNHEVTLTLYRESGDDSACSKTHTFKVSPINPFSQEVRVPWWPFGRIVCY
jgi:hypothetical protein